MPSIHRSLPGRVESKGKGRSSRLDDPEKARAQRSDGIRVQRTIVEIAGQNAEVHPRVFKPPRFRVVV